jgi:hypothetical protein
MVGNNFPKLGLIAPTRRAHRYTQVARAVAIPTVLCLAVGGKQADIQTFQVFKTWKV